MYTKTMHFWALCKSLGFFKGFSSDNVLVNVIAFMSKVGFLLLGSVCTRPSYVLFVNFGMLELTYRLQTFRAYSCSSYVPCENRSNSIINNGTSVRLFSTWRFWHFYLKHNFVVPKLISIFFSSLICKFDGDSKSDILLYLKWLT